MPMKAVVRVLQLVYVQHLDNEQCRVYRAALAEEESLQRWRRNPADTAYLGKCK